MGIVPVIVGIIVCSIGVSGVGFIVIGGNVIVGVAVGVAGIGIVVVINSVVIVGFFFGGGGCLKFK